ncbi:MAG TPA: hypothetical protein VHX15_18700 [Frankiaceae bacterium]|nr:hypothetical protein [Frankiaceae bacterium]
MTAVGPEVAPEVASDVEVATGEEADVIAEAGADVGATSARAVLAPATLAGTSGPWAVAAAPRACDGAVPGAEAACERVAVEPGPPGSVSE